MKLLTYNQEGQLKFGIRTDKGVLDVASASRKFQANEVPATIQDAIAGGENAVRALDSLAAQAASDAALWLKEDDLQLGPCVPNPGKIICIGLNYRKHAEETGSPVPEYPILFNKFNNTIAANGDVISLPKASSKVDYEAELTIVIGKTAKYVSKEEALDYVFGYCNVNDLSARDLQMRTQQWLLGKTCDGFSPIGPYLVTADEVGDPNQLSIKSIVNGEVRQHSNTNDMIFHCDEIISYISQHFTLSPGDIILTGTPEGVVMGYPPEKQVYLQDGDVVSIEIEKLGTLTNRFAAEA